MDTDTINHLDALINKAQEQRQEAVAELAKWDKFIEDMEEAKSALVGPAKLNPNGALAQIAAGTLKPKQTVAKMILDYVASMPDGVEANRITGHVAMNGGKASSASVYLSKLKTKGYLEKRDGKYFLGPEAKRPDVDASDLFNTSTTSVRAY